MCYRMRGNLHLQKILGNVSPTQWNSKVVSSVDDSQIRYEITEYIHKVCDDKNTIKQTLDYSSVSYGIT